MIQRFNVAVPQSMCHRLLIGTLGGKTKVFHCPIGLQNTEHVSFMWHLSGGLICSCLDVSLRLWQVTETKPQFLHLANGDNEG